jgi:hypothetical protein
MVMLTHPDELIREIVINYCSNVDQDITRFKAIGKEWQKRYEWVTHGRPTSIPATDHMFDIYNSRPPQSIHDEAYVRSIIPYGAQWKFEKTIYQNQHVPVGQDQWLRRIVHLFARINDYGQIEDVSTNIWGSQKHRSAADW